MAPLAFELQQLLVLELLPLLVVKVRLLAPQPQLQLLLVKLQQMAPAPQRTAHWPRTLIAGTVPPVFAATLIVFSRKASFDQTCSCLEHGRIADPRTSDRFERFQLRIISCLGKLLALF